MLKTVVSVPMLVFIIFDLRARWHSRYSVILDITCSRISRSTVLCPSARSFILYWFNSRRQVIILIWLKVLNVIENIYTTNKQDIFFHQAWHCNVWTINYMFYKDIVYVNTISKELFASVKTLQTLVWLRCSVASHIGLHFHCNY